ncbi:MAG: hypothetical protein D3909_16955, partial [Candidatus Electrothrix sp. ATG1]|nr:hypothetical protein [Candidatus Electrothrix sp. ATG1]
MAGERPDNSSSFSKKNEVPSSRAAARLRSLSLVRLWQEGRVREMREVSRGPDFLHPVVLELHAKSSYMVLKEEGRGADPAEVRHFMDCWLSFLFHPDLFRSLPGEPEEAEQYRRELLEVGEKVVRKYAEQQRGGCTQLIRHWE